MPKLSKKQKRTLEAIKSAAIKIETILNSDEFTLAMHGKSALDTIGRREFCNKTIVESKTRTLIDGSISTIEYVGTLKPISLNGSLVGSAIDDIKILLKRLDS